MGEALERRAFLRDALARALAALGILAGVADTARALPVSFTRGTGRRTEKAYPLPPADAVAIDKEESVIIARFEECAYAFSLACPHQNTALRWQGRNARFQCPKHKSRYRPNGSFIEGRATRGMDRFAVRRDGDTLLVDLDRLYREDHHAAEWAAAFVSLSSTEK